MMLAGFTGSFMVIAVNGWMNQPPGFSIRNGEVVDVKPLKALFNTNLWHELVAHVPGRVHRRRASWSRASTRTPGCADAATATTGSALAVALSVAALAAPAQLLVGDWAARTVAERQPIKLAAFEGLQRDDQGRALHAARRGGSRSPKALSLLAFHDPNATVKGLDTVPPDDRPPVGHREAHVPDDGRVGSGLAALGALVRLLLVAAPAPAAAGRAGSTAAVVAAGPLAVVALICGWVTTEVGRQPWVVYEVMRTESAVTGASGIPVGYGALGLVYVALAAIAYVMLRRLGAQPVRGRAPDAAPTLDAALALLGLTAYVVLGGADFGAGFWDLTAGGAERGAPVRAMIKRAMSPVWEANHVWLIFVLVMLWTASPRPSARSPRRSRSRCSSPRSA